MDNKIGIRIKKLRRIKKISTTRLAELTGISQSTISKIENNRRSKDVVLLEKIADALEVALDKLTGESVSSIIETRLEEIGMTLEELSLKSGVQLSFLQKLDTIIPGDADDRVEPHEFEWDATIGDYESYKKITKVAETLGIPSYILRMAFARQEVPTYGGSSSTPEDDFADSHVKEEPLSKYTLAEHRNKGNNEQLTEDESIAVNAFLEGYRRGKQSKESK